MAYKAPLGPFYALRTSYDCHIVVVVVGFFFFCFSVIKLLSFERALLINMALWTSYDCHMIVFFFIFSH